jgi:hypothetical protein
MDGTYLMYSEKDNYWRLIYLFLDGYYYHVGIEPSNFEEGEMYCHTISYRAREIPYYWGCFIIDKNILKIQTYDNQSLHKYTEFKVEERWAEIINDTTIHFFKKISPEKKETAMDETFYFRYCENKPDSTNVLMKD